MGYWRKLIKWKSSSRQSRALSYTKAISNVTILSLRAVSRLKQLLGSPRPSGHTTSSCELEVVLPCGRAYQHGQDAANKLVVKCIHRVAIIVFSTLGSGIVILDKQCQGKLASKILALGDIRHCGHVRNIIHLYLISTGKCYMGNHINKRFRALIWTGIITIYCEGSMSCCDNYQTCYEYQTSDVGGQTVYTIPLKLAPTLAMYLTTKVVCRSLTYSARKHWLCGFGYGKLAALWK